jgi:hypothetical protein
MHDIEITGNLLEAGLWASIAVVLGIKAIKAEIELRRIYLVTSVAFLVFGISDLVESRTGSWWAPPWLLLLKLSCIVVFVFGLRAYYRVVKKK